MTMINVFQPTLGDEELAEVRAVFESAWVGRGSRTQAFEKAFAAHIGAAPDQVLAVNSCTEGLFLAMELLEVGAGDEVVLPTISFVGAANAIAARGGRPVFCDVDPATLNPTAADIAAALSPRTRAVMVLHYGGVPGRIAEIAELCRRRRVPLVEDAACAVASTVDGQACGTFGDLGVWSFDAMKILVTGDGGMVWCRDPELAARARRLAYLGMDRSSGYGRASAGERWWEFEVVSCSRRSIINDMTAAIGSVQLRRLPGFIARRAVIARRYDEELPGVLQLRCPPPLPPGQVSSHLFYWIQVDPHIRDAVARRLHDQGVYTTFRYLPLHRLPIYQAAVSLPGAEAAASQTLCIPMHQGLDDVAVEVVIERVTDAVVAETSLVV
jgi:aminotransferase